MTSIKKIVGDVLHSYLDASRLTQTETDTFLANNTKPKEKKLITELVRALLDDRISQDEKKQLQKLGVTARQLQDFDLSWTRWAVNKLDKNQLNEEEMQNVFAQTDAINSLETSYQIFSNWHQNQPAIFASKKAAIQSLANECTEQGNTSNRQSNFLVSTLAETFGAAFLYGLSSEECEELGLIAVNGLQNVITSAAKSALLKFTEFNYDANHAVGASAASLLLKRDEASVLKLLPKHNLNPQQRIVAAIALSQTQTLSNAAIEPLMQILSDSTERAELRGFAALALGHLPATAPANTHNRVIQLLEDFLAIGQEQPLQQTLNALGNLDSGEKIQLLFNQFNSPYISVKTAALDACANILARATQRFNWQVMNAIKDQLVRVIGTKSQNSSVRQHALTILVNAYKILSLDTVILCLQDQDVALRTKAKEELLQLTTSDAMGGQFKNKDNEEKTDLRTQQHNLQTAKTKIDAAVKSLSQNKKRTAIQDFALASLLEARRSLEEIDAKVSVND